MPLEFTQRWHVWCDGDIQQIANTVEDETPKKFKALETVANKQNAARMTMVQNVDPSNHKMKQTLQQGFEKMREQGLNLKLDKKKSFVDFLACALC